MRALGVLLIVALAGLLGAWDLYAMWIGFTGGVLWPFGWELPGGLWGGLLFGFLGLPALWALGWIVLALGLAGLGAGRRRRD